MYERWLDGVDVASNPRCWLQIARAATERECTDTTNGGGVIAAVCLSHIRTTTLVLLPLEVIVRCFVFQEL